MTYCFRDHFEMATISAHMWRQRYMLIILFIKRAAVVYNDEYCRLRAWTELPSGVVPILAQPTIQRRNQYAAMINSA